MIFLAIATIFFLAAGPSFADMYQTTTEDGAVMFTNIPVNNGSVVYKDSSPGPKKSFHKKAGTHAAKAGKTVPVSEYASLAEEKAIKHNVDPKLVKAVIKAESNWNPRAVSPKGAMGIMQLMPKTATDMGVSNPFNPEENIEGGVKYLRFLLDKFDGNMHLAVAAYNAGPTRVERVNGVPAIPETMTYVRRVISTYSGNGVDLAHAITPMQTRIRKVVLEDGTVLFTNAVSVKSF